MPGPLERAFGRRLHPGSVSDEQDLVVLVIGERCQAGDRLGDEVDPLAARQPQPAGRRNDDRHQRLRADVAPDAVQAGRAAVEDVGTHRGAADVILERQAPGVDRPWLRLGRAGRRLRMLAPVIEDPGNVMDARRPLHDAKQQVVVLRAFVAGAKPAGIEGDLPPHHHQVAHVHGREKMLGRPVRLEAGIAAFAARIELVFVRVDHVGVAILVQPQRDFRQGVRRQLVVVIEQGDELAGGQRQRRVRRGGDAAILGGERQPETRIVLVLAQRPDRLGRGRRVVAHADLPVGVDLAGDGPERGSKPGRIGVVGRNDDADERLVGQRGDAGRERRQLGVAARVAHHPARVALGVRGGDAGGTEDFERRPDAVAANPARERGDRARHGSGAAAALETRLAEERPALAGGAGAVDAGAEDDRDVDRGAADGWHVDRDRVPAPIGPAPARIDGDGDALLPAISRRGLDLDREVDRRRLVVPHLGRESALADESGAGRRLGPGTRCRRAAGRAGPRACDA